MHREPEIEDLGTRDYREVLAYQRELVEARAMGRIGDRVLLLEHAPVFTAGRATKPGDVLDPSIEAVPVERGGRVTYHGPGQLVLYPIVALEGPARDLRRWLRRMEALGAGILARFGLAAAPDPAGTGVFVSGRKIASIGIAVRRWVTFHGIALNVDMDLSPFQRIRPCGLGAETMTSMARELGRSISMDEAGQAAREVLREGAAP